MSADFYSSTEAVIRRTGVSPEDLGLGDESDPADALDDFLQELLTEISDVMDRQMRKSYLATDIPAGVNGIAADIAADSVRDMVQSRQTPVVRIDDFAVRTIQSRTLNSDVLKRLRLYAAGNGVASIDLEEDQLAPLPDILTAASLDGEFDSLEAME